MHPGSISENLRRDAIASRFLLRIVSGNGVLLYKDEWLAAKS